MNKNRVYESDYMAFAEHIPDESVDLIISDPVWWEIEQYKNLAAIGKRILKPYGLCIAQVGTLYKFDAMRVMSESLEWYWEIHEDMSAGGTAFFARRMTQFHKPWIMFAKGVQNNPKRKFLSDRLQSSKMKKKHTWQDGEGAVHMMVNTLTQEGDTVADFFTCSGTVPVVCKRLKRDFWACDIDGEMVTYANQRLSETQPNIAPPVYVQTDIYQMAEMGVMA